MTLILSLGNQEQFVQISDRRLSNGKRIDTEESNKATVLTCADGRLMCGFTGLAGVGKFKAQRWLLDSILDCAGPDYTFSAIIDRLKDKATDDFQSLHDLRQLPPEIKKLSIMFSGYLYSFGPTVGIITVLTNYYDPETGKMSAHSWQSFDYWSELRPVDNTFSLIHAVGNVKPIKLSDTQPIRALLTENKPAEAIIHKSVEVVRAIADRASAANTIGKQISAIVLPSNPNVELTTTYHSHVVSKNIFFPSHVIAIDDQRRMIAAGGQLQVQDSSGSVPITFPKVRPNDPCPCKSGRKYKHCHGR